MGRNRSPLLRLLSNLRNQRNLRMNLLLEARHLTKSFPGVMALRDVSFDLRPGEIHALCGENGAGKSTLIKTLSGIHPFGSYEGEIHVDGTRAEFRSLRDAEAAGIAVIYQELALVEEMSVAENIFLGPNGAVARGWTGTAPTPTPRRCSPSSASNSIPTRRCANSVSARSRSSKSSRRSASSRGY